MSKVISAVHHTPFRTNESDALNTLLRTVAQTLQKTPGFLYLRLLRPLTPEETYSVLTFWQSRKHYRAAVEKDPLAFN